MGCPGSFSRVPRALGGVLGKHLGGMLTSRPIFLDFWVRLGGQDEVPKMIFMLKNFSRGPPGGSGRGFRRVFKTQFNIEVSWHRFLIDFGEVWGWPRVALDCALLYYRALRVFEQKLPCQSHHKPILDSFWEARGHQNWSSWPSRRHLVQS